MESQRLTLFAYFEIVVLATFGFFRLGKETGMKKLLSRLRASGRDAWHVVDGTAMVLAFIVLLCLLRFAAGKRGVRGLVRSIDWGM